MYPRLAALSDHLDDTAEAGKDMFQASMTPICSVFHDRFTDIQLAHSMATGEEVANSM